VTEKMDFFASNSNFKAV